MLAHAYLAAIRRTAATGEKPGVDRGRGLLPHTVPELPGLLWHLIWARPPDPDAALA
jgi:hypothetical protein